MFNRDYALIVFIMALTLLISGCGTQAVVAQQTWENGWHAGSTSGSPRTDL